MAPRSPLRPLALIVTGLWIVVALSAGAHPALARSGGVPALFHAPLAHGAVTSTNWAGWAVTATSGTVTSATASWKVPKIVGTCSGTRYSSFWVGIDGYSSSSVEQIGTDSDCSGSVHSYYAWYEFYPNPSHQITSFAVKSGQTISASVTFASGKFTVRITDVTTGKSFSKTATVSGAARSSAEWIAEAPSSSSGVLPLADFGTVHFGQNTTGVTGTSSATISGTNGSIASFGSSGQQITMWNNAGTAVKASTSGLNADGRSFSCTWKSAGP